jgi:hypothetical protein
MFSFFIAKTSIVSISLRVAPATSPAALPGGFGRCQRPSSGGVYFDAFFEVSVIPKSNSPAQAVLFREPLRGIEHSFSSIMRFCFHYFESFWRSVTDFILFHGSCLPAAFLFCFGLSIRKGHHQAG